MNEKFSGKRSVKAKKSKKSLTDWDYLNSLTDEEIEEAARSDSDTVLVDASFLKSAKLIMPKPKKKISLRVDDDVLDWFKKQGRGYQTRMNAVLRVYMKTRKRA